MRIYLIAILLLTTLTQCFSQSYPDLEAQCGDIKVEKDSYTGETKYKTPFEHMISFRKLVNNGREVVYMRVSAVSKMKATGGDVVINFQKGYTISKKVPTNVIENLDGTYTHYAEFKLTKDDISKLKNNLLLSYKVYVYSPEVENTLRYMAYMFCLSKMH